jgi:PAS domain S-box-containing protein
MGPEVSRLAAQLEALLEATPDATVVTDRLGRIALVNAQTEALFGYAHGELVGAQVEVLIPERFRAAHPGHRNRYFQDSRARPMGAGSLELYGLRKDGTEFPAEISLAPLETADGMFAVTAIRDVTARKKVESKFRALLEAAPDAMVIADARGRIAIVNAQTEKLFGYSRDELLGQLVEALIPARFRGAHRGHRSAYFLDPRARPMGAGGLELFGLRKDGTEFPVEISLSPLETEEGTVAMTSIRDATDRKRAEEERARLHAQLETLLADQNRFFTNVSHELRTPLTLVLGPAEKLLAAAEPGSAARAGLEVIARNARTVLRHVNDLLDVAKLEAGRMAIEVAEVDVARLVRVVASHFESLAGERRVHLALDVPERLGGAVDGAKLQRILLNLLSNAFKFTPPGGHIRCALRAASGVGEPEGGLVLEVADSGPGVPQEHRDAVFLRFRQLDATHPGGTGLGLSIAKEFAELHGGSITVGDAPEGGALFRVVLPRREASAGAEPAAPSEEEARVLADELRPRGPAAGSPVPGVGAAPTVLVVEDNPEMAAYVRDVLSPEAAVVLAAGGREALERAAAIQPDLVVTDLMMADGTGEELVRGLRARPELDPVPVVVLTAKADDALRVQLLRSGVQDYVMKPFSADELRARVLGLLSAKRAADVLRRELDSQTQDLGALVLETVARRRELEAALDATRIARDEADRASRVKSNFLALVSHELRTPITLLHLQLERLARDPAPSDLQRSALPKLMSASRRLAAMIEAILEHSRASAGPIALRREPVLLREIAEDAVEEERMHAEAKGLELRVTAPEGLPPVPTDPRFVRVILSNLVSNAVKFTQAGAVDVVVAPVDGGQLVAVKDTGPGIPESDQARIFEAFEQRDPVHMKHVPGVGLGLALVREICAALGARVELRSTPGRGSTFAVLVPTRLEERPGLSLDQPFASA